MTDATQTYAFDNALDVQRDRLQALETLLDPGTIRQLEARGVRRGWRCLEVGAGGGSIARWLCARVGPEGSVLATDLDTTRLREISQPNLVVRVHDVLRDELPTGEFDLVHLRLVLAWLPDPSAALRRLLSALKPSGWLVAEEMDFVSVVADPRVRVISASLFTRVVAAHNEVLSAANAFDPAYGRRVVGDLEEAGLVETGCEGRTSMWQGGGAGGRIWQLTFMQLREALIASRRVAEDEVDAAVALCDDPDLRFMSPLCVTAWGRRRR